MPKIISFLDNNKKLNFDIDLCGYYLFNVDKDIIDIVYDKDILVKASRELTKGFVGLSSGGLVGIRPPRKILIDTTNGNILIIMNGYLNTFINPNGKYMLSSSKIFGQRFLEKLQKLRQKKQNQ